MIGICVLGASMMISSILVVTDGVMNIFKMGDFKRMLMTAMQVIVATWTMYTVITFVLLCMRLL